MRHIVPVTHTKLVRMRRAHAVAAVVEEATGQNGGRALEPDATCSIWQCDKDVSLAKRAN
jgi:hypothetical protein